MSMDNNKAVCILSGGLDSACTAAYLKGQGYELYAITFYYGQRGRYEIDRARAIAARVGVVEHVVADIGFMGSLYRGSNLLTRSDGASIPSRFEYSIVVPARNAIFLTIAGAWAFSIGASMVAYGAHADDEKNYPDCRVEFVGSMEHALNLAESDGIEQGVRRRLRVWSPAVDGMGKADLVGIGYRMLGDALFETWSCYTDGVEVDVDGERVRVQCGSCESCVNRMEAFKQAGIEDKTVYARSISLNKIHKG
ncbi:MAG: 7-cyano-7-deazaguanine synthase QueC [Candidatus Nitrosocaldus sp.]|nr:7-cyano-7-deazaguanine synthase QueC [Candidatus Nitrosocaldus sp.]